MTSVPPRPAVVRRDHLWLQIRERDERRRARRARLAALVRQALRR